jgi:hypothetical protein
MSSVLKPLTCVVTMVVVGLPEGDQLINDVKVHAA